MNLLGNEKWEFTKLVGGDLCVPVLTRDGEEICKGDNGIRVDSAAENLTVSDVEIAILKALKAIHGSEFKKTLQRDAFKMHFANIAAAARFDAPTEDVWSRLKENLTPTRTFQPVEPGQYAEINIIGFEPFYLYVVKLDGSWADVVTITPITDNQCNSLLPDYRAHKFPKSVLLPTKKSRYQYYGHLQNIEDIPLF